MKTLRVSRASLLFVALLGMAAGAAQKSDTVTKEVVGEAAILEDTPSGALKAKEDATRNALRAAVEQVAGVMVSSDTLTQNAQLVSDRVFSNSQGYVKSYDVLEATADAGVARVKVRAVVSTAALDRDLQAVVALIRRFGNPRLMIVLQENTIHPNGTITATGVTTTLLSDAFRADGWRMIDPIAASGRLRVTSGVMGPNAGAPEAIDVGEIKSIPADYVIVGKVNLRQHDETGPMIRSEQGRTVFVVSGEYDFAIFETRTASQIGKLSGRLAQTPVGQSLISYERSSFHLINHNKDKLVKEVRGTIVDHFANTEQNGSVMVVKVSGFSSYSTVQAFKKVLSESISGVKSVNQRGFSDGRAEFDVTFTGSMDDLVSRLADKTFKGKRLNVTAVNGANLELALAGK